MKGLCLTERVILGLLGVTLVLVLANVILNIVIVSNQSASNTSSQSASDKAAADNATCQSDCGNCQTNRGGTSAQNIQLDKSQGFREAANNLLNGIDITVDPCVDFYQFSCNNYLKNNPIPEGRRRIGTYDQAQKIVFEQVRKNLQAIDETDTTTWSTTERIVTKAYNLCHQSLSDSQQDPAVLDKSAQLKDQVINDPRGFNGFPALAQGWTDLPDEQTLWKTIGSWESKYGVFSLLFSYVTVDYKDTTRNALYLNQAMLLKPRDFYVKPQFLKEMETYKAYLIELVKLYNTSVSGAGTEEGIQAAVTAAVQFEIALALAVVPDDLLRNYRQQYNQYNAAQLANAYPGIQWRSYLEGLGLKQADFDSNSFVVMEPAFFGVLDVMLRGKQWPQSTIVNFIVIRLLMGYSEFLGGRFREIKREIHDLVPHGNVRYEEQAYDEISQMCVGMLNGLIPYGVGYIYVKNIDEREKVRKDVNLQTDLVIESFLEMVDTLDWMTPDTKAAARRKIEGTSPAQGLVRNVGWPDWFGDFTKAGSAQLDEHHLEYASVLDKDNFFDVLLAMQLAGQNTENIGLLGKQPDRKLFGDSPATVNAWYQPERNSITFPYGILNPPYYKYGFPQAYNYAGQGGTAGHELSHGFDDEGVQFGPVGELSNCSWSKCGWMDEKSTYGFINMAQCVVTQYNEKCCPVTTGGVHCANGATTQGENIADLAGQQAAYRAYRKYVATILNGTEEGRLPGLEQFTPNQIFWITYGYSWCMNSKTGTLVKQLLIDPHAPGSCRVNQVVQDIPEFGRDFNCPIGSPMYPVSQNRCKVWTGV